MHFSVVKPQNRFFAIAFHCCRTDGTILLFGFKPKCKCKMGSGNGGFGSGSQFAVCVVLFTQSTERKEGVGSEAVLCCVAYAKRKELS